MKSLRYSKSCINSCKERNGLELLKLEVTIVLSLRIQNSLNFVLQKVLAMISLSNHTLSKWGGRKE